MLSTGTGDSVAYGRCRRHPERTGVGRNRESRVAVLLTELISATRRCALRSGAERRARTAARRTRRRRGLLAVCKGLARPVRADPAVSAAFGPKTVMRNAVMRCGKFGRLASHVGEIGDFWTRICQEVCLDAAKGLWDSPSSGEYVRRRTSVTLPGLVQCHGARYGQGPILAMLAVLGRKTPCARLRVAPVLP